ncbi:MAG: M43 family zinc metalloprotease [Bacteroidota bacterium]
MKKILLLTLGLSFLTGMLRSQIQEIDAQIKTPQSREPKCGFNSIHKELENSDPAYKLKTEQFNNFLRNGGYQPKAGTIYQVPVVVHVMDAGNSLTDITDQQIKDAIRGLNEMMRKVSGTPGDGNGVDAEVEYVLAVRDPLGNCTNGINRFDMTGNATYMASGVKRSTAGITDAALKALISWDKNKYYNIWLVTEIDNNNGGSGIQGYAFFASSHGTASDGAVILANNFENPYSSTGVHEIGHSLNLFHTFEGDLDNGTCPVGNGCGSDVGDCCADTPPHVQSASDCVVAPNACDGGSSSDLFIHNYMDYSSDDCQNEFTADQAARMQAAVSTTRASFLMSSGNNALVPVAGPGVDFSAASSILCGIGQTVQFYDLSSCVPNSYLPSSAWAGITFNWTFTNGTTTYTSTDQNPQITFNDVGSFDVTLSITDAAGSDVLTKSAYLVVSASPTAACIPSSNNEGNFAQTVNNVKFNTINNSTSTLTNVEYTDNSCSVNTIVEEGQTYSLSVSVRAGGSGAEVFEAYIDYNNDGDFADAGEQVLTGSTAASTSNTISGNVTIPATAVQNTLLRMRIIGETTSITAAERACANMFISDVEDYGVLIQSACVPAAVTADPSVSSVCAGDNAAFSVTATGDATINYQWMEDTGGGFVAVTDGGVYSGATTSTLTITGATAGMNGYLYFCEVTNSCGTDNSASAMLNVASPTIAAGTVSHPTACLATDGSIEITGSGTGDLSYVGTLAGTDAGVTLPYTLMNLAAGTYDFTFDDGCTSNTISVTLNDPGAPAMPTITAGGPTTFCDGGSVMLTSSSAVDNVWSTGETTQSITVTASGTYSVFVSTAGCNSASSNEVVTVDPSPAMPTIVAGGATTFCNGGSVILTSSSAVNNVWSTGETTQSITVSTSGNYNVTVSLGACTATSADEAVTVTMGAAIAQGTTVNPTACGAADGSIEITGAGTGDLSYVGTLTGTDAGVTLPYTLMNLGAGTYDFTFNDGCNSNTVSVTLSDPGAPAMPTITAGGPTTFCDGGSVMLTSSSAVDNVWSTGETTQSITVTASGTYSVFVSTAGCNSASSSEVVTVDPVPAMPTIVAGGATTFCNGGSVILTSSSAVNNTWSTGETTQSITVSASGNYNVTVSLGACTATSADETVTVTMGAAIAQGTTVSPTVCGAADGSIEITGAGTGDLSYVGTLTGTDAGVTLPYTLMNLGAGTYDFTFNDGCNSNTVSVTISDPGAPAMPTITAGGPTTFCDGGSVMLTSSSAVDNVWSTGETTQSITVTASGTYSVFVSTAGCNSASSSEVVTVDMMPALPTITAGGPTTFCSGGSVVLTSSSAVNNTWSTGETTQSITVTTAGNYSVGVTNGSCTNNSMDEVVTVNFGPAIAQGTTIDPSACLATDGSIEITGAGTGDLSYVGTMTGTDVGVTLPYTLMNLGAGTYDFTFSDGCNSNVVSVTLSDPGAPAMPTITAGGPTTFCDGGSVTLTSSSAVDNVWSTGETTQAITVTTSGTYSVFVSTAGCSSASSSEIVTVNPVPAMPTITAGGATTFCNGGSVVLTSSSAINNTWSTGETTQSITVTLGGNYNVTVDQAGCTATSLDETVTVLPGTIIAQGATFDPSVCSAADGSIEITGVGTGDLSYTGTLAGTDVGVTLPYSLTNLGAGTYDFTFDDGCLSNTVSVTLSDPGAPAMPVITAGGPTTFCDGGSVTLTSSSAVDNVWSTGETTQAITVTASGTYSVFVSTAGCSSASSSEIVTVNPVPAMPAITAGGVTTFCVGGSVVLTSSSPVNNTWSTGETTQSITAMVGGNYNVTVDQGGCTETSLDEVVTVIAGPAIAQGTVTDPASCGAMDGSIEITGIGTGDLSYTGTASGMELGVSLPFTVTGLGAGTYDFVFNDGCSSNTVNVSISDPGAPAVPAITASGALTICDGESLTLTSSSATDNVWSTGETTQAITVTTAGTYSVFVSTAGCSSASASEIVTVTPLVIISAINVLDPSTCGGTDGALEISGTGTGNLNWTGTMAGSNLGITLPYPFSGLTAGTYNFTFDSNGCTSNMVSVSLTDPGAPAAPTISAGGATTFCDGGSVILTSSSATDNLWSTGETTQSITVSTTSVVTLVLNPGGCTSAAAVQNVDVMTQPAVPTITASGATTFCDGGSIVLTSSSATDNVWSTGETTQSITVTTSGTYNVNVVMGMCSAISLDEVVTVNPVETIAAGTATDPTLCGVSDGTIEVLGTATGDLSYTGPATGTQVGVTLPFTLTSLAAGTYDVTFNDGCASNTISVTLNPVLPPAVPTITAGGATTFCDGGSVVLTSSAASNIMWSTGETTQSITVTTSGNYNVTVTEGTCSEISLDETVTVNPLPAVPTITAGGVTTFCDGGSVVLTSSSAINNTWSTGETTQSITVTASGNYNVTVTETGCSSVSLDEAVTVNPTPAIPVISASGPTDICIGDNVVLTSSSATDNLWSTGETTQSITVSTGGTYNVTVSNAFCSSLSADVTVNVNATPPPVPTITTSGVTTFCAGGNVVLTSSSATDNHWSTGATTQSITVAATGTYDVFVNVGGCIETSATVDVTVNPMPATPVITADGPATFCSGTTLTLSSSASAGNTWTTGATTQDIAVSNSGSFTVTVDELGCTATSAPFVVTVNQTPLVPIITAQESFTFCEGGSVDLTTTATSNFQWSTGETSQTINVSNTDDITVSVTVNGCTSTSATVNVVEHANPVVTLAPFNDVCNTSGLFVLTNGIPSGGNYTVNGIETTTFNPQQALLGANNVVYTLTDINNCSGSANGIINVLDCVGVEEEQIIEFTLFPNPSGGQLNIQSESLHLVQTVELRDELGRLVLVLNQSDLAQPVSMYDFADGLYTVIIKGDGFEKISKVQLVK